MVLDIHDETKESETSCDNNEDEVMEEKKVKKEKKKKDKKKQKKKNAKRKHESVDSTTTTTYGEHDDHLEKRKEKKKRKQNKDNGNDNIDRDSNHQESSDDKNGEEFLMKKEKLTKKEKKRLKKEKKEKKKKENATTNSQSISISTKTTLNPHEITATPNQDDLQIVGGRIVSFSASAINETDIEKKNHKNDADTETNDNDSNGSIKEGNQDTRKDGCTLLLFYQYIEPILDESGFQELLHHVESTAEKYAIMGRARVAHEGLNCTLTGSYENIRLWCKSLRSFSNSQYFSETEFKLTDNLPMGQAFKKLHAFKVDEIVNYGLAGERAPNINMTGVHLEPKDYHKKMTEDETVIIDVRNHYEAAIGKFNPPTNGAKYIDPMMRKSTEFPVWLDKPETKEMLKGKQVLMYCTGGVRCERASALLRTKIETEEDTKALGIKGVFQLQGGIDKYFRDFPEGGWWQGKNYVFDKRFSHAPPVAENLGRQRKSQSDDTKLGNCAACNKPWDKYRGKRRCPTCGVPLLICRECDAVVTKRDKKIRCDLCITEGITSKQQLRDKEREEMAKYEAKLRKQYGFKEVKKKKYSNNNDTSSLSVVKSQRKVKIAQNPEKITRLFVKNLSVKEVDQPQLCELIEGITHIEWIMDRNTNRWYGTVFVEVATPEHAAKAVGSLHKQKIFGRVIQCAFSKPDTKSIWPPPNTKI